MNDVRALGFPAPLLSERAVRLPVHYLNEGLLILDKPAGVLTDAHPLEPDYPALVPALLKQAEEGKPELMRAGVRAPYAIYALDAPSTGMAMFACNREASAYWRNLYGSYAFTFTFQFLARERAGLEEEMVCELPLAQHRREARMLVSHKTGKQTRTHFRRLERLGEWSLWEAQTSYLRSHQIRLHAVECGLVIVGESLYAEEPLIYLSQFKRRYIGRSKETPLYDTLALHLGCIAFTSINEESLEPFEVASPLPDKFSVLLDKLRTYAS